MGLEISQRVRDDSHFFWCQALTQLDIVREYARNYRRHVGAAKIFEAEGNDLFSKEQATLAEEQRVKAIFYLGRVRRYLRAAYTVVRYAECGPAIEARELKRKAAMR